MAWRDQRRQFDEHRGRPSGRFDRRQTGGQAGQDSPIGHPSVLRGRLRGWKREGRLFVSRSELLALFRPVKQPPPLVMMPPKRMNPYTEMILRKARLIP